MEKNKVYIVDQSGAGGSKKQCSGRYMNLVGREEYVEARKANRMKRTGKEEKKRIW